MTFPLPTATRTAITCAPLVFAFSTSAFFSPLWAHFPAFSAVKKVVFEFIGQPRIGAPS